MIAYSLNLNVTKGKGKSASFMSVKEKHLKPCCLNICKYFHSILTEGLNVSNSKHWPPILITKVS